MAFVLSRAVCIRRVGTKSMCNSYFPNCDPTSESLTRRILILISSYFKQRGEESEALERLKFLIPLASGNVPRPGCRLLLRVNWPR